MVHPLVFLKTCARRLPATSSGTRFSPRPVALDVRDAMTAEEKGDKEGKGNLDISPQNHAYRQSREEGGGGEEEEEKEEKSARGGGGWEMVWTRK